MFALNSCVKKEERKTLAACLLYIFCLFLTWFLLRPVRDELGIAGGVDNLAWLFSATLIVMLICSPLFSWALSRWKRERFIAISYRFFAVHLLIFWLMMHFTAQVPAVWTGRIFFVWVSVFNLFVVSTFWSFVLDIFSEEQGKRLFGLLAAGATLGGLAGSSVTVGLIEFTGQSGLILIAIILLEICVQTALQGAKGRVQSEDRECVNPPNGGLLSGISHTFRSPYLAGIALFMLIYSITSTFFYFQQAEIAAAHFPDKNARTAFFATLDIWVNGLTLLIQLFLTAGMIRWLGIALTLAFLPGITLAGFSLLAVIPSPGLFIAFQVLRRVSNFALARPSRELLFTALPPEDRYNAKNFIDTVVYRLGDQLGSWSYTAISALSFSAGSLSFIAVPLSAGWLLLSLWLGRKQCHLQLMSLSASEKKRG